MSRPGPSIESFETLVSVGLHSDINAYAIQPLLKNPKDLPIHVGRTCFHDGGEAPHAAGLKRICQRGESLGISTMAWNKKVVIMKDEDFDVAFLLHLDHLISNVIYVPQPITLAGLRLFMPRRNA